MQITLVGHTKYSPQLLVLGNRQLWRSSFLVTHVFTLRDQPLLIEDPSPSTEVYRYPNTAWEYWLAHMTVPLSAGLVTLAGAILHFEGLIRH
jgi:hypothetical protein